MLFESIVMIQLQIYMCVCHAHDLLRDRYVDEFDAESPYYSQMIHNLLIAAVYDGDNDGSSRSNNNSRNSNGGDGRGGSGSGSGSEEISTSDSSRSAATRASGVSGVSGARVGTNRLCMQTSRNHHANYNQWARSNWRGTLPIAFVASLFQDPHDPHEEGAGVEGAGVTGTPGGDSAYHIDGDNDASCGGVRRARYVTCTCIGLWRVVLVCVRARMSANTSKRCDRMSE